MTGAHARAGVRRRPRTGLGLVATACTTALAAGLTAFALGTGSNPPASSTIAQESRADAQVRARPVETPDVDAPLGWGPWESDLETARAYVEQLSLPEVAGQVIVARYYGDDPAVPAALVSELYVAGVLLNDASATSADLVRVTAEGVQAAAQAGGRPWPAVVAVDHEGGRVAALRGLVTDVPAFARYGKDGDSAATRADFERLGAELRALGVTLDFAPVADVVAPGADPVIGDRAASDDPAVAATAAVDASAGLLAGGTLPTVKHFPGHGSVTGDSHVELPELTATVPELEARDLIPFRAAVEAQVPMVMLGHLDVTTLDPGVPATLSPAAYDLLRDDLGFEGVAVTDSMGMGAITTTVGTGEAEVRALLAGADMILMPADTRVAHTAIVAAVESGRLPRERLDEAAARIGALQLWWARGLPR
ncbi:glycoside hydrolase family 3 N-terminal domain-containing protein [Cellulomonas fimi]|uniref:beta-N-acetylhexosaminidase n=1 Tax=Cellulomonas fimi TaxID=1708 RepID=A0A7Y0LVE3_CELFI|nr:glycoside hydrolase family 3 N-terminal domain-containing protein [Cellulomonas fimi]NMR18926.1 glycosyl hyrolase family 3 [Cellulomonas fimi]